MSMDEYYKLGYSQGFKSMGYYEAKKIFDDRYPQFLNKGSWQTCSWVDGWNDGNQKVYDTELASEIKAIQKKYGFTIDELKSLKQFFTDDITNRFDQHERHS